MSHGRRCDHFMNGSVVSVRVNKNESRSFFSESTDPPVPGGQLLGLVVAASRLPAAAAVEPHRGMTMGVQRPWCAGLCSKSVIGMDSCVLPTSL